jgi:hypothetical protein
MNRQNDSTEDRLNRERSDSLKAAILADPSVLERLPPARDALVIAALTNSISIASFLVGVALVGWFGGFIGILLGLFLIGAGMRTFVHVRRLPIGHKRFQRSDVPTVFSLVDELCEKLGVKAPQFIELTAEHRVVGEYRLRGSSLHVGMPLVRSLSGDELSAAFAQALAALAFRSGPVNWLVENARRSLHHLSEFVNEPTEIQAPDLLTSPVHLTGAINNSALKTTLFAEILVNIGRSIVRRPVNWIATSFTARSYRRTHLLTYRSDAMAAQVTSPQSVVGVLSAEVLQTSVHLALQRRFVGSSGSEPKIESASQLWDAVDDFSQQVPSTERLRLLRRSSLSGQNSDPEFPPIGYRVEILHVYNEPTTQHHANPVVSEDRFNRIWTEMALRGNSIADEFAGLFDRSLPVRH